MWPNPPNAEPSHTSKMNVDMWLDKYASPVRTCVFPVYKLYNAEVYLETSLTSTVELSYENN